VLSSEIRRLTKFSQFEFVSTLMASEIDLCLETVELLRKESKREMLTYRRILYWILLLNSSSILYSAISGLNGMYKWCFAWGMTIDNRVIVLVTIEKVYLFCNGKSTIELPIEERG
jgi:hypothetical protein